MAEPAQAPLQPGEVVFLASGGPLMTVEKVENGTASCVWFSPTSPCRAVCAPNATDEQLADLRLQAELALADPDCTIVTNYEVCWSTCGDPSTLERGDFPAACLRRALPVEVS